METSQSKRKFDLKNSISARLVIIAILTLLLLIPMSFIKDLIHERMSRQDEVIKEINNKWGTEVLLYGPILTVPYKDYETVSIYNKKTKSTIEKRNLVVKKAYFFPENLDIKSTINPEERKRGIYKTAVYKSSIDIKGSFIKPDFSEEDINSENILWDKAKIIVQTSNLKGVNNLLEIKVNENNYRLISNQSNTSNNTISYKGVSLHSLQSKKLKETDLPVKKPVNFSLNLNVNGSEQIRFIPVGKETQVNIKSNWKTANFLGEFIPQNSDKISDDGFNAKWKVLDINRPFAQQAFGNLPNLMNYSFGVNFKIPVDEYQKSERSVKYGILVIGLTFLIFFLIQTMSKIIIHPFQYLMIGIALSMFYTLLISISEHSSYLIAYVIAGTAVVTLTTFYAKTILSNNKFTLLIGGSLSTLYTFIFVIIQLESYALLVGSIGLFIILGIIMFASRKIDWQNG